MKRRISLLLAFAFVAGCGGSDPVDSKADNTSGLPAPKEPAPDSTGGKPTSDAAPAPTAPDASAAKIPAALHGRWGMTPGDCTSTRGDAKGLLIIGPDGLRFYESRAVPAGDSETNTDSIRGDFTFTGEGQTWTRFQALSLQRGRLVRTESNPMASYTYAKCN